VNHLEGEIKIYKRRNGKFNIYIDYAAWATETDRKLRANKRLFVNWLRKQYPTHLNEFREMPGYYYGKNGTAFGASERKMFVAYDFTKSEIMMMKLAWTWKETKLILLKLKRPNQSLAYDYYIDRVATQYISPTKVCKERFKSPNFKQKLLKE
jgi:hypothetical protein